MITEACDWLANHPAVAVVLRVVLFVGVVCAFCIWMGRDVRPDEPEQDEHERGGP